MTLVLARVKFLPEHDLLLGVPAVLSDPHRVHVEGDLDPQLGEGARVAGVDQLGDGELLAGGSIDLEGLATVVLAAVLGASED